MSTVFLVYCFFSCFVFLSRLIAIVHSRDQFYHGSIDRIQAEQLLVRKATKGSFLIRYSRRQRTYCVSMVTSVLKGTPNIVHNLLFELPAVCTIPIFDEYYLYSIP